MNSSKLLYALHNYINNFSTIYVFLSVTLRIIPTWDRYRFSFALHTVQMTNNVKMTHITLYISQKPLNFKLDEMEWIYFNLCTLDSRLPHKRDWTEYICIAMSSSRYIQCVLPAMKWIEKLKSTRPNKQQRMNIGWVKSDTAWGWECGLLPLRTKLLHCNNLQHYYTLTIRITQQEEFFSVLCNNTVKIWTNIF